MIPAHGATLTVTATSVTIEPTPLLAALGGSTQPSQIPLAEITSIDTHAPTTTDLGWVKLAGHTIFFSPNHNENLDTLLAQIHAAQRGELPSSGSVISGFDFAAIDVETANDDWGSICQVGVARYQGGTLTETKEWLCTPPPGLEHFDAVNIGIHGITADQVAGAPSFAEILPEIIAYVGQLPVVAHNAQFDMTAFSRASKAAGITPPHWSFGCSLALARNAKLGIANHRLPTVAEHFNVEITKHHDALSDAVACGEIIRSLASASGHTTGSFYEFFWTSGFTLGALTDAKVQPVLRGDAHGINIAQQRQALLGGGVDAPAGVVGGAGGSGGAKENKRSRPAWKKAATPEVIPETNTDADPEGTLYGHNVTLTGDFEPYDKSMLWSGIAERGGTIGKNVTKKTTMLIIGPWHNTTTKQKRAEELIEKGQSITFWTAAELYKELGLDEEPPF